MTSDKSYSVEQRLNALLTPGSLTSLVPGPWTAFNPLSNLWAVQSPFTGAWCRWVPGNGLQLSFIMTPGTDADNTVVGNIPSSDSAGNGLRPAQEVDFPVASDELRINTGSNNDGARFHLLATGNMTCFGIATAATTVAAQVIVALDAM